jgi:rRNA-processing protein FCF1
MKVMLDSNIFDRIVTTQGLVDDLILLAADEKIDIVTTHVQEDELNRIPDTEKRNAVMQVPRQVIKTGGAIYGVSKYGQAKYGDGSVQGYSHRDVHKGNPKHAEDALISLTALKQVDVFVTEDKTLRKKVTQMSTSLQGWSFQDFVNHIEVLKNKSA